MKNYIPLILIVILLSSLIAYTICVISSTICEASQVRLHKENQKREVLNKKEFYSGYIPLESLDDFEGIVLMRQNSNIDHIINTMLEHEDLIPGQTPFRITHRDMRHWKTVLGYPVNKNPKAPYGRKNFIFFRIIL